MPPALKDFLSQCKARLVPLEEVIESLQKNGWSEENLNYARQYYSSLSTVEAIQKPNPPPRISFSNIFIVLSIILVVFSAVSVSAYFVAMEKIPLKNVAFQKFVSQIVFSVPFLPKSPRYLLTRSVAVHQKLSRSSFDLSFATTSNDFRSLLGTDKFDLRFTGSTDISNTKNPRFSFTVDWAKDFSARALKPDQNIYLKIDKLPSIALSYLMLDSAQITPILDKWVVIDTTPLETEARKNLIPSGGADTPIDQTVEKLSQQILDEEILPQIITSSDNSDGFPCSKLVYKPNSAQLDRLYTIYSQGLGSATKTPASDVSLKSSSYLPSQYVKDFVLSMWIDQENYYMRKVVITFNAKSPDTLSSSMSVSGVAVAMALKLSNFGQPVTITPPSSAIKPEEYFNLIQKASPRLYQQQQVSTDAVFKTELYTLSSAAMQYAVDHRGQFPGQLSLLVPAYLKKLPDSVVERQLVYKLNKTKTKFIIYSAIPDSSNPEKPFTGIDSISRSPTHYSQKDLNNF